MQAAKARQKAMKEAESQERKVRINQLFSWVLLMYYKAKIYSEPITYSYSAQAGPSAS